MFQVFEPCEALRPYVRRYAVSEHGEEHSYTVLPGTGMVMGLQYSGRLYYVGQGSSPLALSPCGITGISSRAKVFRSSQQVGSVLIYFTETGLARFSALPANELFNGSVSAEGLFAPCHLGEVQQRLAEATSHRGRVDAVEHFLLRMQRPAEADPLVQRAVERIAHTGGTLRIAHLQRELCISASPLEKRFRSVVGCTPKTFSSIVRFRAVLRSLELGGTPAAAGYDNRYFDQAHFIRDFVRFTGTTPEKFRKSL